MEKWEYRTIKVEPKGIMGGILDVEDFDYQLNKLGEQGWELVTSVPANYVGMMSFKVYYTFKRVIQ